MESRFDAFVGAILELNRIVQKLKDVEMKKLGLKGAHLMVLYQLGRAPEGLSAVQLTDRCREDKAAVSRTLSQLTAKGLVERAEAAGRSYRTPFFLTATGHEVAAEINRRIEHIFEKAGSGLTSQQRHEFYDMLAVILKGAEQCLAESTA